MNGSVADMLERAAPFFPVVPFDPAKDRFYPFDFTVANRELGPEQIADTERFAQYIHARLRASGCRYGIGGYGEHRTLYARSAHFDGRGDGGAGDKGVGEGGTGEGGTGEGGAGDRDAGDREKEQGGKGEEPRQKGGQEERGGNAQDGNEGGEARKKKDEAEPEPRRLHLGTDIWGPAGTPVRAPMEGIVHSFAFNNKDSDYGATILLSHSLEPGEEGPGGGPEREEGAGSRGDGQRTEGAAAGGGRIVFHTLYGHLSLHSLKNLRSGMRVSRGEVIGEFGMRFENGNWPPHLHFQVILDLGAWEGDYPGVCRFSERERWLANCPDPEGILRMKDYVKENMR